MDYQEIRKLTLQALYLDDELSELLVLKGGNALSILELTRRGSFDLDFSLYDFNLEDKELENRFKNAIETYFEENDFKIFKFTFTKKPKKEIAPQTFKWGGYSIKFKFIEIDKYDEILNRVQKATQIKALSQEYSNITGTNEPVLIELSKGEYCKNYNEKQFEYITLKIYSPWMIIFEKLRALCQQMEEYTKRKEKAQRARDFFDIYTTSKAYILEETSEQDKEDLKELVYNIFEIKEVDLSLLEKLEEYREFHRPSFEKLKDVIAIDERDDLKEYDFYFDETKKIAKWVLDNLR